VLVANESVQEDDSGDLAVEYPAFEGLHRLHGLRLDPLRRDAVMLPDPVELLVHDETAYEGDGPRLEMPRRRDRSPTIPDRIAALVSENPRGLGAYVPAASRDDEQERSACHPCRSAQLWLRQAQTPGRASRLQGDARREAMMKVLAEEGIRRAGSTE
jgi:hypothetical protein